MSDDRSVERLMDALRNGSTAERNGAVEDLWKRYFNSLARLARNRLRGAPGPEDGEDVALSAFNSFCCRAADGRFPQLNDRKGLWRVMAVIVLRKVANLLESENAQKRGGGRVKSEADLPADANGTGPGQTAPGREPDPADAAEVADLWRRAFDVLADDEFRRIALLHLDGHTDAEIAAELDYHVSTIERRLRLIRGLWKREVRRE